MSVINPRNSLCCNMCVTPPPPARHRRPVYDRFCQKPTPKPANHVHCFTPDDRPSYCFIICDDMTCHNTKALIDLPKAIGKLCSPNDSLDIINMRIIKYNRKTTGFEPTLFVQCTHEYGHALQAPHSNPFYGWR